MRKNLSLVPVLFSSLLAVGCTVSPDDAGFEVEAIELAKAPGFELFQDGAGEYRFHLVAKNGEIILASEGYAARTGALGGILSVLANAADPAQYELTQAQDGQFYFNLRAQNGKVIATSETYVSKSNAKAGQKAVAQAAQKVSMIANKTTGAGFARFQGQDGQFYFHLKAKNGQIVLQSEGYQSEAAAWNGAFAVVDAVEQGAFFIERAVDGQYFFTVVAANGETVAVSELYTEEGSAVKATKAIALLLETVQPL